MSAKTYALWGGVILLVLGIIGLLSDGDNRFVGLNSEVLEDIIHIVAGAILAYGGWRGTAAQTSMWSKVFGVIFLVVGLVGFVDNNVFGIFPTGLGAADNVVHLVYGVLGAWAGWKKYA